MNANWLGDIPDLEMDQAYLTFISTISFPLQLYIADSICEECPAVAKTIVEANQNTSIVVHTTSSLALILKQPDFFAKKVICSQTQWFSEYGVYYIEINYKSNGEIDCSEANWIRNLSYADSDVIPSTLFYIFAFLFIFYNSPAIAVKFYKIVLQLASKISGKYLRTSEFRNRSQEIEAPFKPIKSNNNGDDILIDGSSRINREKIPHVEKLRVSSLDAFRGIAVVLMVFINAGGGGYWYFEHVIWNGMNFAELPHGWFNWIMGFSVAISNARERQTKSTFQRIESAVHRTARLFLLGLVMSSAASSTNLNTIPFMGVLQDLGCLYLFAVMMDLIMPRQHCGRRKILDFDHLWRHWLVLVAVVIIQNGILFGFDVPDCGRGYIGPGGLHMQKKHFACTGGAASYIDQLILGSNHLLKYLSFANVYSTYIPHDSYGPFGLIGQLVQVYFGILAGEVMLLHKQNYRTVIKQWVFVAVMLIVLKFLLCNSHYCILPCNRRMWTLTYSCIICSSAPLIMTVLYLMIDVNKKWSGWPFIYPGMNSAFIYVAHFSLRHLFPFKWNTANRHANLVFLHLWQTIWWIIISGYLYKKKIFLRL